MYYTGAIGLLGLVSGADGAEPIPVTLIFVSDQLRTRYAIKFEYRAHHSADIAKNMHEAGIREKLAQTKNVQGIFWRSIDPAFFGPGDCASRLQPTPVQI